MKIKFYYNEMKRKFFPELEIRKKNNDYYRRFIKYSFLGTKCRDERQYEAVITRWYHTIEKGLAYTNFRSGFGKRNLDFLLTSMENYVSDGYSPKEFFYETALSVLAAYQKKNARYGYIDEKLNARIAKLPGKPNNFGGTIDNACISLSDVQKLNYKDFVCSRHSMRHFSAEPVDKERILKAIQLAQKTPSACNRQGWQARIILDKEIMKKVLQNQNGNEGFGQEFGGLICVTGDLRCFNREREIYQVYMDAGMYAQSILNALHFENIASVPLSGSLTLAQEKNVRKLLGIAECEVIVMFIGIGNYPDEGLTTRSERKESNPIFY